MGKIGCLGNKKRAVLAIFYCGLQSVKSFHTSVFIERDYKDTAFFGTSKIFLSSPAKCAKRRNSICEETLSGKSNESNN